jgi:UDP-N-acetylmuramoyl-tripeptide--D-alanyl-D-alanine ligase
MDLTLREIADVLQCQTVGELSRDRLAGVSTDSRHLQPGELFVALRGENFDGHKFLQAAKNKGSIAAMVDSTFMKQQENLSAETLIVVEDTLRSYQDVARYYRQKFVPIVVAITGSAGKTTCKEFIHAVLSEKFSVHKNKKSFNNHVGVPATLLALKPEHEILVAELGTSNFGEIAHLSSLVEPDVCVLLNIGYAHLEFLKSLEGVAKAKMEIFEHAAEKNISLYNADDDVLRRQSFPSTHVLTFGINKPADITAANLACDKDACYRFSVQNSFFQLAIPGRHNVYNALAAISIGLYFDVPVDMIQSAIERVTFVEHRMNVVHQKNMIILDDVYNANPGSCAAALQTLADIQPGEGGRRVAVLGDMLELGEFAIEEHEKLATVAWENDVDALFLFGDFSKQTARKAAQMNFSFVKHFESKESLLAELKELISDSDVLLIKGSRSMHMEDVVDSLAGEQV